MNKESRSLGLAELRDEFGGDDELIAEVLGVFAEDTRTRLEELEGALGQSDGPAAAGAAHRLKGASASICAYTLHSLAAQMEQACHAGDLATATPLLEELKSEADKTFAVIAEMEAG